MRSAEPFAADDFVDALLATDAGFVAAAFAVVVVTTADFAALADFGADRAAGVFTDFFTDFFTGLFMDILVELLVGMGLSFNRLGL